MRGWNKVLEALRLGVNLVVLDITGIISLGMEDYPRESVLVKTSLDHLPEPKKRELDLVVETLRAGFARAIANRTQERFRNGKILKIILFGSYARGDWVEDPVGRYYSDFDILVVVDHEDLAEVGEFWVETEDELLRLLSEGKLRTPVTPMVHSLEDVNEKLARGRYFFMDILKEGIVLFEEPDTSFVEPVPLNPSDALDETNSYYAEWLQSAGNFYKLSKNALHQNMQNEAAFLLHQAAERAYQTLFLVRTLYMPKTHNLNRLRSRAEGMVPELKSVWPGSNKDERQAYERLREAYIKARYSREYRISETQLVWLGERVALLQERVRNACIQRIEALKKAA